MIIRGPLPKKQVEAVLDVNVRCPGCGVIMENSGDRKHITCTSDPECEYRLILFRRPSIELHAAEFKDVPSDD